MSTRPRRSWLLLAPVVMALGPVAWFLAQDGALLVHRCVADGAAGRLGLRMALVRPELDCPSGLALGVDGSRAVTVALVVAVPVLLAHLAGAGLGLGAATLVSRLLGSVARVLGRRARRLVAAVPVVLADRLRVPAVGSSWSVVPVGATGAPWRRGPPVVALV